MKNNLKKLIAAVVVSGCIAVVQGAWADTIEGTIDAIGTRPNIVTVAVSDMEVYDVYGVRFNYLAQKYDIALTVNQEVSFEVFETFCADGTIVLKACEITVGDAEPVALRPCIEE